MRTIIEDLLIGFVYGLTTCFVLGGYGIPIAVETGILWALGGQGSLGTKMWRRWIMPCVQVFPFILTHHLLGAMISLPLQIVVLHVGYGEPSTQPPDPGSWLGRRFGRCTRLVWFALLGLALALLAL